MAMTGNKLRRRRERMGQAAFKDFEVDQRTVDLYIVRQYKSNDGGNKSV